MNIVLNETECAERSIESKSIGQNPCLTIRRIARYYFDIGYRRCEVVKRLENFVASCGESPSSQYWMQVIDREVGKAKKTPAINISSIVITKPELAKIEELGRPVLMRLSFTLLCLAKYYLIVNPDSDYWVGLRETEIMKMANISASPARRGELFRKLHDAGMIRYSKKIDNPSVKVLFALDGEAGIEVMDFRNLGNQYMMYLGGPYFVCKSCEIVTRYNNKGDNRKPQYCDKCAREVDMQNRRIARMRYRYLGQSLLNLSS